MSLLMEALKRAEESKRLAEGNAEGALPDTSVATTTIRTSNSPRYSPLPDLSLHSDAVNADLAAVSSGAPLRNTSVPSPKQPTANSRDALDREAARNVFTAKRTVSSPNGFWLFLGLSGLAALGIGAYFWWQLQAASGGSLNRSVQTLPPLAAVQQSPASSTTSAAPPPLESTVTVAPPATPAAPDVPEPLPAADPVPTPREPSPVLEQAAPESPIRLNRSQPKPNQTLEHAYEALQAGRLDEAQRGYEMALREDSKNVDALLGLATLAAHNGQAESAQAYYLSALESDPNDATAQAGLINLRGASNAGASESQLKTALARQPDSSALYFALGNLYARQDRWSEAQQAYFHAYSSEPENADYIFNLAISLDHLHQNKLAAQYYQMALNSPGTASSAFDKNQARTRLLDLQP